jgi:hypothetical protein
MNYSNFNSTIINKNKPLDLIFIIFISVLSISLGCLICCYFIICLINIIRFITFIFTTDFNYRENKNPRCKFIYDILFGSLSLPVITEIITTDIDNNIP